MIDTKVDIALRISVVISLIIYVIGLLCAWNSPEVGYEASIYASTPIIFWVGIFLNYFIGTLIFVLNLCGYRISKSTKYIAIIVLVLCSLSFVAIGTIRGNIILGITDDVGTHIGEMKTLLESESISSYYPSIYTGPASLILVASTNLYATMALYPLIYLGIFILGIYLLSRELFQNQKLAEIVLLIALYMPLGSAMITSPYLPLLFIGMQSTIRLMPIVIYIIIKLFRTNLKSALFVASIFCISLSFYHPMAPLLVIMLFISVILFNIIKRVTTRTWNLTDFKSAIIILIAVVTTFLLWSWRFHGSNLVQGILSISTISEEELAGRGIGKLYNSATNAMDYGYGVDTILRIGSINIFIYLCLIICSLYCIRHYINRNTDHSVRYLYTFGGVLMLSTLCLLVIQIGFKYSRFLDEIYLIGIISAGLVIYVVSKRIISKLSCRKVVPVLLIVCILMAVCVLSLISFHPSPFTNNPGYQTTQNEFTAAETILPLIDYNKMVTGITLTGLQRYVYAIYGSPYTVTSNAYGNESVIVSTKRSGVAYSSQVPVHFGYDTGANSLANHYGRGDSIFITERDKKFYEEYYPEIVKYRWTQQDFKQLTMDIGLERVYNNGGTEMYYVL